MQNPPIYLLVFLLICPTFIQAQESSKPKTHFKPYALSIGYGGSSPFYGLSGDMRLTKRLFLEAGIGGGISANGMVGLRYFITNPTEHRLNIYSGLFYSTLKLVNEFDSTLGRKDFSFRSAGHSLYLPIGLTYNGKRNMQANLNGGVIFDKALASPYFGLSVGYRFGDDIAEVLKSPDSLLKNYISISIAGFTPIFGAVYERLVNPQVGIEFGLGFISAGAGLKLYFPKLRENKLCFHAGISRNYEWFYPKTWKTYLPIGVSYINSNKWRFGFDAGPKWRSNPVDYESFEYATFNIRLGKGFN